jgi:hypothetical protein
MNVDSRAMPPVPTSFTITPAEIVMLVIATTFIIPFAKWAAEKLWGQKERDVLRIQSAIENMGEKVGSRLDKLEGMFSQHQGEMKLVMFRLDQQEADVSLLREELTELQRKP